MSKQTLKTMCGWLSALLVSLLFPPSGSGGENVSVSVGQNGMMFSPNSITIAPGDAIDWVWYPGPPPYTSVYHSVTAGTPALPTPNVFDSGTHTAPYLFTRTFPTAGTFPYFCQVHGTMMRGTVVVTGGASPTPTPGGIPSTLGNIATRLRVQSGDNALIGGLIATGTASKRVIVRAIGPSLIPFAGGLASEIDRVTGDCCSAPARSPQSQLC